MGDNPVPPVRGMRGRTTACSTAAAPCQEQRGHQHPASSVALRRGPVMISAAATAATAATAVSAPSAKANSMFALASMRASSARAAPPS
ncbi:hypothetical protein [Nonomuraea roseoviolacea]|uniref:Uncharacterized protein n=1 Tax=Nonomuraea roseoviolacea subsp. carminata TaxID=160689 RepID=A0ABT1KDT9_9ACTN|nr:hypothetical protein [Nonomuraea roseoviolacea]MCP2352170.1 hypothetical protein [Nonomuraea roseoviolacea subsp. carminata]